MTSSRRLRPPSPRQRVTPVLALVLGAVLALLSVPADAAPPPGPPRPWAWPLQPPHVVATFDPPDVDYGAGHRGIDLSGQVGQPVTAVDDGVVAFAGGLAGTGIVSIDHEGGVRSTYQPLTPRVRVGQHVRQGQVVGLLALPGSHCLPAACLHLGARRGETYLDPLAFLASGPIRLLPLEGLQPDGLPIGRSSPATTGLAPSPAGPQSVLDLLWGPITQARGWA